MRGSPQHETGRGVLSDRGASPRGVLLAYGEGIRAGTISSAQAQDVAPTLLHLCGLPVPGYGDGRVLTEVFEEEESMRRPVEVDEDARLGGGEGEELADSDQETVAEHLRGLGYL